MKKLIFNISVLLILIFTLDFAIGSILRYFYFKENTGVQYYLTYALEKTKADIVIFGGSRAKYHYVPDLFEDSLGMAYYNTGCQGNSVFTQLAVLKSILKRHIPSIIILDYKGSLGEGDDGYDQIFQILPYYKTHEEIRNIIELKSPFEKMKLWVSEIYPFNSNILNVVTNNLEVTPKVNYCDRGFVGLIGDYQSKIDTIKHLPYKVDSNKLNALHDFMRIAKDCGAKVFVIYSPIYERYIKEPQEISIIRDICSCDSIPFWNFSQDTLFLNNENLFYDSWHLNKKGAIIFSKIITHMVKDSITKKKVPLLDI